ncbi:MAG: HypC/HybG/HupF family hydrogenase formation chaperone [Solirubrobacterales bacterium]|nr:HypC/HybG/HupF family hydrogenase formation chaperone [Solirubrobacterales bacterium]
MSVCDGGHCVTCSDEAVSMTVLRVDGRRGLALCTDRSGVRSTVEIALVEPVTAGDELLVHAGTAIAAAAKAPRQ